VEQRQAGGVREAEKLQDRILMNIGGLQKQSFIDYPGKISCVLFLAGCNFTCPYCHNPQLTGDPAERLGQVAAEDVFAFLGQRRRLLEGVVISGGEPTLHPDLPELCMRIQTLGYPVKLDTNGSRPQMLAKLISGGLVDYLAMDIKTDPERYAGCVAHQGDSTAILASLRLIMESGVDYEFRTTCVKPLVTPHAIANIARLIEGGRLYALQPFKECRMLHPDYFQGTDPSYSPAEMDELKLIADPWVAACTVR
jgi:pyruvate formate lyase activating enzyme